MMMLSQGIVTASRWMYHQMVASSTTEPMMGVAVHRVQKRPRTTTTNDFRSSTYASEPMEGVTYTDRRYMKVCKRRQITNHSTNSSINDPQMNSLSRSISPVSMDNEIQRLTNDMGRLTISTDISIDMPVELQKESLDGLVDRMASLCIKDDGAEDDGDLIMTQASTLLDEPVYHFGIDAEQQVNSFRHLVELTPTQKLRRHRQRRQEFMKKRLNKFSLKMTRRN